MIELLPGELGWPNRILSREDLNTVLHRTRALDRVHPGHNDRDHRQPVAAHSAPSTTQPGTVSLCPLDRTRHILEFDIRR